MDQHKILQTDLLCQSVLSLAVAFALLSWLWLNMSGYWLALSVFLCLLSWQFFSGIYIAAELRCWYRGVLPICLLVILVTSILLMAFEFPMGVMSTFGVAPVISIANLIIGIIDFQHYKKMRALIQISNEQILDSEDIF
ncbi:MAG: hypothetical protein SFU99_11690 [Saprospiraceae bacterium]|nr:hypothetical protein [Saprospiraceae bacterium]